MGAVSDWLHRRLAEADERNQARAERDLRRGWQELPTGYDRWVLADLGLFFVVLPLLGALRRALGWPWWASVPVAAVWALVVLARERRRRRRSRPGAGGGR